MNTLTYHSINAPADKAWLAYIILPSGDKWRVFFEGATESEAKDRATAFYESEREKWKSTNLELNEIKEPKTNNSWDGVKQHHLAGLVWVINKETKDKRRVPPDELDAYLAKGYVKGGPRTAI